MFGNKNIVLVSIKEMPYSGNHQMHDYTFAVMNEYNLTKAAELVRANLAKIGATDGIGNLRSEWRTDIDYTGTGEGSGAILVSYTIADAFEKIRDDEERDYED